MAEETSGWLQIHNPVRPVPSALLLTAEQQGAGQTPEVCRRNAAVIHKDHAAVGPA